MQIGLKIDSQKSTVEAEIDTLHWMEFFFLNGVFVCNTVCYIFFHLENTVMFEENKKKSQSFVRDH